MSGMCMEEVLALKSLVFGIRQHWAVILGKEPPWALVFSFVKQE